MTTLALTLLTIVLPSVRIKASKPAPPREWIGGYVLNGTWTPMRMHATGDGPSVTIDVPSVGLTGAPAAAFHQRSAMVDFRLRIGETELMFNGEINPGSIEGAVISGAERGRFQLMRFNAADRAALAQYEGAYHFEDGHFVYIQFWDELGKDQLGWFDESGQIRALFSQGNDRFFIGSELALPVPLEARVTFHRDGRHSITSLTLAPQDGQSRTAQRSRLDHQEEVSFRNGDVLLSGTLISPARGNPHAAIVVAHGSGPQDRRGSLPFVRFLVRHGIAVLVYDKRGVGGSTGDWRRSSFNDLADDAVAAVHFLQTRPSINPRQIGLFGVSQGGWIGPLAASRSHDVSFVVSVSGPGVSPAEETLDFLANEMRVDGLSQADIDEAVDLTKTSFDYARSGKNWEGFLTARKKSEEKPWFPFMDLPDDPHAWVWELRRLTNDYNPAPVLKTVRCPVLAFFGGQDLNVVAGKNVEKWSGALTEGNNRDFMLLELGSGNHLLLESESGSIFEFPHLKRFLPDYSRALLQWLCARLDGVVCSE